MNKIIVLSDSTCDLSAELINKYDIKIIPLHVAFQNGDVYDDGVNIDLNGLYDKVGDSDKLPTTSAAAPFEFEEVFRKYIDEGYDIFYTGIGAKLSCTLQNAKIASEEFPKGRIRLVDSGNLSTGIGLLVIKACELRDQGLSLEEIGQIVESYVPKVKSQFVINRLDFLHKGGRCSSLTKFIGNAIKLKPLIAVREGTLGVKSFAIGPFKKGLSLLIKKFSADYEKADKKHVFITHSVCPDAAEYIRSELNKAGFEIENLYETSAGCVIGTHCGPRTIGILYIKEK